MRTSSRLRLLAATGAAVFFAVLAGSAGSKSALADGDVDAPAWSLALGGHTLSATAGDVAGNEGSGSTTFTVGVTFASLKNVVSEFCSKLQEAKKLNLKLAEAEKAKKAAERAKKLDQFEKQVRKQVGKSLTAEQAALLISFAEALK